MEVNWGYVVIWSLSSIAIGICTSVGGDMRIYHVCKQIVRFSFSS